ncbi:retrotransposon hot spot (RHS) protein [Trypanosoma cruzi]|nr:retrotransposon hot spot (RHS) protein [Trypanosoma cruzi]
MSWEFIYVQRADSVLMSGWQRRDFVNSNFVSEEENQESLSFWKKKTYTSTKRQCHPESLEEAKLSEVRKKQKIGKQDKLGNERDSLISGEKNIGVFLYSWMLLFSCGAGAPAPGGIKSHRCQECPTLSNTTVTEEIREGVGLFFLVKKLGDFRITF